MFRTSATAFVIALTGAIAPGPVLALVIGQVLAQGIMAAVFILIGHALIEVVLVAALAGGARKWLCSDKVRGVVSVIGGLVLLVMAQDMVRHAGCAGIRGSHAHALPWYALIAAGLGVSLSNPYFTGWWATVGTGQVAALGLRRPADYIAFYAGHEMGDVVWYLFVAVVLLTGASWLTDAVYQRLLVGCGLLIGALGIWFIFVAARLVVKRIRAERQESSQK
jgi:threonine/homoserine/homoserine lactone efflux protein